MLRIKQISYFEQSFPIQGSQNYYRCLPGGVIIGIAEALDAATYLPLLILIFGHHFGAVSLRTVLRFYTASTGLISLRANIHLRGGFAGRNCN